jgi:hypothetical protein
MMRFQDGKRCGKAHQTRYFLQPEPLEGHGACVADASIPWSALTHTKSFEYGPRDISGDQEE